MPLSMPKLDDRNYTDLVTEALALIPTYAPEWTDHNPSDPGITLIELFAYLAEMQIYQLDRITDNNSRAFLKLLNGPEWQPSGDGIKALQADIRTSVLKLHRRERAVTCHDFEILALEADPLVARARCVAGFNLEIDETPYAGHISVVLVTGDENKVRLPTIIAQVKSYLEPRRLLTTHLHVVPVSYVAVGFVNKIRIRILPDIRKPGESEGSIAAEVVEKITHFLHPLKGGEDGQGWPFGRNVYASEIYQLLDQLEGVDSVESFTLSATAEGNGRQILNKYQEVIGISIQAYELVSVQITQEDVEVLDDNA
jgi:hypothetical protein